MSRSQVPSSLKPIYSSDPETEKSLRHSIKDGVYYSAMIGGGESYFSAFAIFLQASTTVVGLLASLPPLLASTFQLLSAWLGRKRGKRKQIVLAGALIQAVCLIPIALLPLYTSEYSAVWLIPLVFLYFCGPNLASPQWNSLVGELLPEARRGRFFAERTKLSSVASVCALAMAGFCLEAADRSGYAYWGFLTIFVCASGARLMSFYHLSRMHEPSSKVAVLALPEEENFWRKLQKTKLLKFSLFFAFMQFSVAISGPYFTLYMLRDLQFSYLEFMFISAVSILVQFLTLNRWGRLSDLFGNRLILITTGCIITVIPSLWLVSPHFVWILIVQMISGLGWAGFTLSSTAFVFDLTPTAHRATLFAAHNVLAAVAVFLGASTGAAIAALVPVQFVLVGETFTLLTPLYWLFGASCLMRIVVALSFLPFLKEVRRVRPMSVGGVIFRVTRLQPIGGLVYEVVGRLRAPKQAKHQTEDADSEE